MTLFGENKIVLTQRSKDGLWIFQEISFTNRQIIRLLDLVPEIVKKAENQVKEYNKGCIGDSCERRNKKKSGGGEKSPSEQVSTMRME